MKYKELIIKMKQGKLDNVSKLKNGCSNNNYVVDRKYFVRISSSVKPYEYKILSQIQQLDFIPKLYCYDLNTGDMVSEYIEGNTLMYNDINDNKILKNISDSLKILHSKEVYSIFNPVEQIHLMYKKIKKHKEFEFYNNCINGMKSILEKYSKPQDLALCHNDITAGNIIIKEGKIYLIDFEFSGMNDIYYDLAGFCCMLNDEKREIFLNNYFKDEKCDKEKLNDYIKINFLWNASWNLIKYLENGDINHLEYAKEYIDLIDINRKK